MLRNALVTAGLLGALATPALADTYTVDKQHTEAGFQVRHLLTKVRGTFRDVSGSIAWDKADPARSTVEFHLKTASVDTGVEQRDNHLRSQDFFWAEKYPEIVFKSTEVTGKLLGNGQYDLKIRGDLTLHGVTRQIVIPVKVTVTGNDLRAVGEFSIDRSDFKVKATSAFHGMVRVRNTVKFTFDIVGHRI